MYKKILIANRGEIAVRIIRAAKELGIKTVAVYSDADKNSLHVNLADQAFNIGKPLPSESYLVGKKIISVAKKAKCDGIHPGYGFLSENADFAENCIKNKIDFIGPSAEAIRLMGDKITSREIAKTAKVPLVPGTDGEVNDNEALGLAKKIGYPLMIKASAGGGGKGMRLVHEESEFENSLKMAKSEAKNAFNNDAVFIERFIQEPRHIEIQILGDKKGNVVHLFERECSIQRRHQKVVEEAPSPGVSEKTRKKMGEIAVKLAKKVSYSGAGTVEFIMDQKENFYFLEMNTRVQVEHPITEMITGIDIVKEMIKVSYGHELSFKQKDIERKGHAIECRVCAEDPDNNFLPTPGTIFYVKSPQGPGVRDDSSLFNGYKVTTFYDPMLSKLIVWSEDRDSAIKRMSRALSEYIVLGVKTNLGFLVRLMDDKDFISGKLDTGFIEKHKKLLKIPKENSNIATIASAIILHAGIGVKNLERDPKFTPWKYIARRASVSRNSMF
ncbi:acetyl-CoA carboxylase biotin carboxylase subunit [bacterium]|jgi:acetyl-CoA carboxylase biotin carboxylase subunit|nr:acetyl-CoA carboxylase biotin carboxylase subunit [bacterium]MBT4634808.1 acetyl-CoA carboxylase biotin carboxylase subunit [bacterium]